ncbi:MAG: hypothetical protein WAT67_09510 [Candidatus Contendobacter sp.]
MIAQTLTRTRWPHGWVELPDSLTMADLALFIQRMRHCNGTRYRLAWNHKLGVIEFKRAKH